VGPPPEAERAAEEGEACCICLEDLKQFQRVCVFPCRHRLHAACAKLWLDSASRRACPTCRREVPEGVERIMVLPGSKGGTLLPAGQWTTPLVFDEGEEEPPSQAVASVAASCHCRWALAEACLRSLLQPSPETPEAAEDQTARAGKVVLESLKMHGAVLLAAMQSDDFRAAHRLLREGSADLNVRLPAGLPGFSKTPLIIAVRKQWFAEVQLICEALKQGVGGPHAHLDSCDEEGLTALMWAALRGDSQMCDLLLGFGASTTARNHAGLSALDLASTDGCRARLGGPLPRLTSVPRRAGTA